VFTRHPPKKNKKTDFCGLVVWYQQSTAQTGFTLIELVVSFLILGILAAISLPYFFSFVGRSREADAKQILSTIAQAQQAYFFEKATFATNYTDLEVSFSSKNYQFPNPTLLSPTVVKSQANAINAISVNARNYGLGVYFINNTYRVLLCQSLNPGTTTIAPDTYDGNCSDSGISVN